jgi:hypothetical protein
VLVGLQALRAAARFHAFGAAKYGRGEGRPGDGAVGKRGNGVVGSDRHHARAQMAAQYEWNPDGKTAD